MKKLVPIVLTIFLLLSVMISAEAAAVKNRVYSDKVYTEKGATVDIPVKIENNTGIMGFAVDVSYDSDVLTPVSIAKSDNLSGSMNDSIETGTAESESFKVVYTGTEEYKSDGVLFTLKFIVSDSASEDVYISFSYSEEDTFNEEFKDVKLNCEEITVCFSGKPVDPDEPSEPDPGEKETKLSVRIKNWAAELNSPWNTIMTVITAPVVFILQLIGR